MNLNLLEGLNADFIPLPAELWGSKYFPSHNWYFTVSTDDSRVFFCSREKLNGEGIYSAQTGLSIIEYLRKRIGVPAGALVTLDHLLHYGRTNVDFYRIDEETYFMDFSV